MADIRADVNELYVAFFGRPGEAEGAAYWNDFIEDAAAKGRSIDAIEQEIAARFADADEATTTYSFLQDPTTGDVGQFIDAVYANLFNREPEETGRNFWHERFEELTDKGTPAEQVASLFVLEMLNAAQNADAAHVQNKVQIATAYSERFLETGATFTVADDLQTAKDLIANTGATPESLQQALARLDEILDANTANSGVVTDGYLADATLFADQNGNGVQDPSEPTTTTDNQGRFAFTDADGTAMSVGGDLLARGGTDVTTGLVFHGTLRASEGASTVSPLTTLVTLVQQQTGSSTDDAEARVKQALGLGSDLDLKTFDPFAILGDPDAGEQARMTAHQVQGATTQVVNTASLAGNAAGGASGETDIGLGNDQALAAIADAIGRGKDGDTVDLTDQATLSSIVRATLTRTAEASGQTVDDARADNTASNVAEIARNANQRVQDTVEGDSGATDAVVEMARIQKVAQGDAASSVRESAQTNNFDQAVQTFTGDTFDQQVAAAQVDPSQSIDPSPDERDGGGSGGGAPPGGGTPGTGGTTEVSLDALSGEFDADTASILFVEDAGQPSDVAIRNFSSDDRIRFEDATFVGFTSTANDLLIDARGPQDDVSEIRLIDVLDGAVVSDEASAEAALGFDAFLRPDQSSPTDPSTDGSVMLDDASGPFDAANGDVTFVDDATAPSDVVIDGFGRGDAIEVQDSTSFGFTSTALDILVDARGPSGQVSEIRLVGVNDGSVVTDEDSAEDVLGFNAFEFS